MRSLVSYRKNLGLLELILNRSLLILLAWNVVNPSRVETEKLLNLRIEILVPELLELVEKICLWTFN